MPHPKPADINASPTAADVSEKINAAAAAKATTKHTKQDAKQAAKRDVLKPKELMRFSVAMPEDLLVEFDQLVARRGLAKNRSEVIRDLVRDALVETRSEMPGEEVFGTLTIVYNHHANDLQEKLHTIQHDYFENIISTMHVHVDAHMCLEVIVLRGETTLVQSVADLILGTKGVQNGKLVLTTTGRSVF